MTAVRLLRSGAAIASLLLFCAASAGAQNCRTSDEIDTVVRSALIAAAQHDFDLVAQGDAASLRQNAIASAAADFGSIETTVKDSQAALAGVQNKPRPPFLLEAEGTAPLERAEFYCGVFGKSGQTRDSAVFLLNNLPPGKYGVVVLDTASAKGAYAVSFILQQQGSDWKLGGLYIKPTQTAGHDSDWFVARAREFKAKGQVHNAWLYYLQARSLATALPFMSTAVTDRLYDEANGTEPADVPADGKKADLAAGTVNYKLNAMFPQGVGNDLDLVVKYDASDISNTNQAYQTNIAVIKALIAKHPELKDAFAGLVARAVDPSGRDFGTLLVMKDLK